MKNLHASMARIGHAAVLCLGFCSLAFGGPPGGGAAAAPQPSAAASSTPTSVSSFFTPSSINIARPDDGWANWSLGLKLPKREHEHVVYLCYEIKETGSANAPFVLQSVARFKNATHFVDDFPCYPIQDGGHDRAMLRGDRLRIAIDMDSGNSKAFFDNVSLINLNVTLAAAPPIQIALLRSNLGSTSAVPALGGNEAPEAGGSDPLMQCFQEILKIVKGRAKPCTAPKKVPPSILLILWPYTLPGDVVPTVSLNAAYSTPENGAAWTPNTFYPAGRLVQCPQSDICEVAPNVPGQGPGTPAGFSGTSEPKWPGPGISPDGANLSWTPIVINYRVDDAKKGHAPDGKPIYQAGDRVVWSAGATQVESEVQLWQPNSPYVGNQSVILCPAAAGFPLDHERLCGAKSTGISGGTPPDFSAAGVSFADFQIHWRYSSTSKFADIKHWQPSFGYHVGEQIRCTASSPQNDLQHPPLCAATVGGVSGDLEPYWPAAGSGNTASAAQSPPLERDNQVIWGAFTPSASAAAAAADQVVPLWSQQLAQVHAPSQWGLSTAGLRTTSKIPSAYTFQTSVASPGCPTAATATAAATNCPSYSTSYQRNYDIALMVSPYLVHQIYAKFDQTAPNGIDAESRWTGTKIGDWLPEPIAGFGLNSVGNSYYAGLSVELFVRNLQFIYGYGWIKAPFVATPVSGPAGVTPATYTAFTRTRFVGIAYNISGLISGH